MDGNNELHAFCGLRLPVSLHQALQAAAQEEDRTISSYVRVLLREDLTRRGMLPQDQAGHPAGGQGGQHGHQ